MSFVIKSLGKPLQVEIRVIVALLSVFIIAGAPKTPAQSKAVGFGLSDWHISTGRLDISNFNVGDFSAPLPLTLTRPGSTIRADRASGNFRTKKAVLIGDVVMHDDTGMLSSFAGQAEKHQPAVLTCDKLTIDGVAQTYIAEDNVHFVQGNSDVRADRAVMNGRTHDLHLYGHVQLQQ